MAEMPQPDVHTLDALRWAVIGAAARRPRQWPISEALREQVAEKNDISSVRGETDAL
jgi:hypothetical protein